MGYERPEIEDYGTLSDLTASLDVGGPEDAILKHGAHPKPGHSLPPGPPKGV
jgi:hypothetical protein